MMLARQTVLYGTRAIGKEILQDRSERHGGRIETEEGQRSSTYAIALETRVARLNLSFQILGVTTSLVFDQSLGSRTTARLMSP